MAPADDRLALLLRTLREQATTASPDWTDGNDPDPGVTLVSLFAYLAEQLESRAAELPASARAEAARIGLRVAGLDRDSAVTAVPTAAPQLERPNYVTGQLLTADDLALEQAYVREKMRRLHLAAFDAGVVAGLDVTVDTTGAPPAIVVSPGSARDAQGELIVLDTEVQCPVPPLAGDGFVLLRYVERVSATTGSMPSRVAEGAALSVSESMDDSAVLLARLTRVNGQWTAEAPTAVPEPDAR